MIAHKKMSSSSNGDSMELVGDVVKVEARKVVENEVIFKTINLIIKGTESSQPRLVSRAIRQNVGVRKYATPAQLSMILEKYVPSDCVSSAVMKELIGKIAVASEKLGENKVLESDKGVQDDAMDTASGADKDGNIEEGDKEEKTQDSGPTAPPTSVLPEIEVYFFTLLVTTLLRYQLVNDACMASAGLIQRIGQFNRRSLDIGE